MTSVAQTELKGFSRTIAELEWLLLVLVLLYYVMPTTDIIDQWGMLLAMAIYAVFVISFRYEWDFLFSLCDNFHGLPLNTLTEVAVHSR